MNAQDIAYHLAMTNEAVVKWRTGKPDTTGHGLRARGNDRVPGCKEPQQSGRVCYRVCLTASNEVLADLAKEFKTNRLPASADNQAARRLTEFTRDSGTSEVVRPDEQTPVLLSAPRQTGLRLVASNLAKWVRIPSRPL